MPKRSLHRGNGPENQVEQLNKALDAMLARNDGRFGKVGAESAPKRSAAPYEGWSVEIQPVRSTERASPGSNDAFGAGSRRVLPSDDRRFA